MSDETPDDNAYLHPEKWKAKLASPYTGGPRQARPMPLATDAAAEGGDETVPHFLDRKPKSATEELAEALGEIQRLKHLLHHESDLERATPPKTPSPSGIQEETGALRDSIGTKIDTTLVPYEYICAAAVGLNYGALHYAPRNFEKGLSEKNLLGSIERHHRALVDGEVIDKDSGVPHACLLASSVAMYITTAARGDIVADLPEPSLRAGTIGGVAVSFCDLEKRARDHRAAQGKDY